MIIDFQEIWDGRRGSFDLTKATREYTRSFRAITDNTLDGPAEIMAETQLPQLLVSYADANGLAFDDGAISNRIQVEQDGENPFVWTIRVEFSSASEDTQQAQEAIENPLDRPPIFKLGFARFSRVAYQDLYGNSIANSAGVPFSPLPEVDEARPVLTVTNNEADFNAAQIIQYQDAINSDEFQSGLPGTWKVSIEAESVFENGLYYWKKTYTFEYRPLFTMPDGSWSAWNLNLLDSGFSYLDATKTLRAYLDLQGNPPSDPILLDGKGNVAQKGVTSVTITNPGSGYGSSASVTFSGGGGSGAAAVATLADDGTGKKTNKVALISITNPGSGYTSAPSVSISGANGLGANATATASLGKIPTWLHFGVRNWLPFSAFNLPPIG